MGKQTSDIIPHQNHRQKYIICISLSDRYATR